MKLTGPVLAFFLAACGSSTSATEAPPSPAATAAPADDVAAAPPSPSTIETRSLESSALGVSKDYVVYLPRGYASSPHRRYPVLYMLHGLGGSEDNWRELGIATVADQLGFEAIIVMPDGDDGFYVNWANPVDYDACLAGKRAFGKAANMKTYCVKQGNYEDYIATDLVGHIDATLRTVAAREGRAIGGLSMGGYGALYLAMRRPGMFGAVASHAGWTALRYKTEEDYAPGKNTLVEEPGPRLAEAGDFAPMLRQIFGETAANWKAHDPVALAPKLAPGQLAIYLDCGTQDEFRFQHHNQYLSEVLTKHEIPHQLHLVDGGRHNDDFWRSRVDDSLAFVQQFFAAGVR